MKRKTKFAAMALIFVLALSCCLVPALAQEEAAATENTVTEDTVTEDTAAEDASLADSEGGANSWRYSNGVPIHGASTSTYSAIATFSIATLSTNYTTWPIITGAVAYGIDVSKWQGDIDWAAAKDAGVDYAIIRCGYTGSTSLTNCYTDVKWEQNASACEALGISYGVYYYSCATTVGQAKKEAEYVLSLVEGHTFTYPIYYDLEDDSLLGLTSAELAAIAEAFCSTIEAAGYTVGVYANLDWWTNRLTSSVFDQWERWVAQWNTSCDYTGAYTMWQCSSSGIVDGISGNVDLNIDFGAALSAPVTVCTHDYVAGAQTAPTCTVEGSVPYTCSKCGATYTETIAAAGHVAGEAVTENNSVSGGSTGGSYDSVVYCTVCGEELSRVTIEVPTSVSGSISASTSSVGTVVDAIEEPEIEGNNDASIESNGLAESNVAVDDMGSNSVNTDSNTAVDNTVSASTSSEGGVSLVGGGETADNAVSASTSSEGGVNLVGSADSAESNAVLESADCEHIAADAVAENSIDATCTEDGSYESVVYCTACGTELSREVVAVSATGHQFLWVVAEEATATEDGSQYQQCVICGEIGSAAVLSAVAEEAESSDSREAGDDTSKDDAATATSSEESPATGDATNVMVWVISLLMSATVLVMIMMSHRRRIRRKKQIAGIIERIKDGR